MYHFRHLDILSHLFLADLLTVQHGYGIPSLESVFIGSLIIADLFMRCQSVPIIAGWLRVVETDGCSFTI